MSPSSSEVSAMTSCQLAPPAHASTRPAAQHQENTPQDESAQQHICAVHLLLLHLLRNGLCANERTHRRKHSCSHNLVMPLPLHSATQAARPGERPAALCFVCPAHLPGAGPLLSARSSVSAQKLFVPQRWPDVLAQAPQSHEQQHQTPADTHKAAQHSKDICLSANTSTKLLVYQCNRAGHPPSRGN